MDPSADVANFFDSEMAKERRAEILHVRIPKTLKARIEQLRDFWDREAKKETPDAKDVSEGDVVVRLMAAGIEKVWTDRDLPAKPTQAEVDDLLKPSSN